MERLLGQGQAGRRLPRDVGLQPPCRLSVREPLEGLKHHDRRHHVGRHRRPTAAAREQVGEHLVGERGSTVFGQECVHRALAEQVLAERSRVQELAVGLRGSLHSSLEHAPAEIASTYPGLLSGLLAPEALLLSSV
ncbi:MAG: hypothetical protein M3198_01680 [Actinomycetota bacterium]|nr:hypothetical protein [Actinomycetota bacterium]